MRSNFMGVHYRIGPEYEKWVAGLIRSVEKATGGRVVIVYESEKPGEYFSSQPLRRIV